MEDMRDMRDMQKEDTKNMENIVPENLITVFSEFSRKEEIFCYKFLFEKFPLAKTMIEKPKNPQKLKHRDLISYIEALAYMNLNCDEFLEQFLCKIGEFGIFNLYFEKAKNSRKNLYYPKRNFSRIVLNEIISKFGQPPYFSAVFYDRKADIADCIIVGEKRFEKLIMPNYVLNPDHGKYLKLAILYNRPEVYKFLLGISTWDSELYACMTENFDCITEITKYDKDLIYCTQATLEYYNTNNITSEKFLDWGQEAEESREQISNEKIFENMPRKKIYSVVCKLIKTVNTCPQKNIPKNIETLKYIKENVKFTKKQNFSLLLLCLIHDAKMYFKVLRPKKLDENTMTLYKKCREYDKESLKKIYKRFKKGYHTRK